MRGIYKVGLGKDSLPLHQVQQSFFFKDAEVGHARKPVAHPGMPYVVEGVTLIRYHANATGFVPYVCAVLCRYFLCPITT